MQLPAPLRPWSAWLDLLPRELALALGPLLRRTAALIGALAWPGHAGEGEPDGFDGLDHRGPYERLLTSEWLLLEEAPDEFVRRAGAGEHAFLRLARPEPAASHRSLALFDAGPGQLGAPRLAHLAALLVLERRAQAAGAGFAWGVLQDESRELHSGASGPALLALLRLRSAREPVEADLTAWREVACLARGDESWLVGGEQVEAWAGRDRSAALLVEEAEGRALRVRTPTPGHGAREAQLELPDEQSCVRLLRDPLGAIMAAPGRLPAEAIPTSNLVFGVDHRLYARCARGVVAYLVPGSPAAAPSRPRLFAPTRGQAVAAGGRYSVASVEPGRLHFETFTKQGQRRQRQSYAWPGGVPEGTALGTLHLAGARRLVHLPGAHLLELPASGTDVGIVAAKVLAAAPVGQHLAFVDVHPTVGVRIAWMDAGGQVAARRAHGSGRAASFAWGGPIAHASWGLVGIENGERGWQVHSHAAELLLVAFAGTRVIGVVAHPARREPALLLIEEDGRSLLLSGRSFTHRLGRASAPIVEAAISPVSPHLAWLTSEGELTIHSLSRDAVVARHRP
jgi:hypothetical protein